MMLRAQPGDAASDVAVMVSAQPSDALASLRLADRCWRDLAVAHVGIEQACRSNGSRVSGLPGDNGFKVGRLAVRLLAQLAVACL